jgi:hypothetical protein
MTLILNFNTFLEMTEYCIHCPPAQLGEGAEFIDKVGRTSIGQTMTKY